MLNRVDKFSYLIPKRRRFITYSTTAALELTSGSHCNCSGYGPFVCIMNAMACWSSGMIRASGARGPGFDSRTGPVFKFSQNASFWSTFEIRKGVRSRGWFRSTDLWVMGPARFLCATLLKAICFCTATIRDLIDQKCDRESMFLTNFSLVMRCHPNTTRLRSSVVRALVL